MPLVPLPSTSYGQDYGLVKGHSVGNISYIAIQQIILVLYVTLRLISVSENINWFNLRIMVNVTVLGIIGIFFETGIFLRICQ